MLAFPQDSVTCILLKMPGTPTVPSNGLWSEIYWWICSSWIKITSVFSRYFLATSAKSFAFCTTTWLLPLVKVLVLTTDLAFPCDVAENFQENNFWYFSESLFKTKRCYWKFYLFFLNLNCHFKGLWFFIHGWGQRSDEISQTFLIWSLNLTILYLMK